MPSLKDIRKRITSVKNTQKITRAMKLVAAARLRRAQESIIAARPYSAALEQVIFDLAARAGSDAHPLFEKRKGKRAELVVMTSDRGLAGSFNAQLIRVAEKYSRNELADHEEVTLRIVGKKGNDYFKRRDYDISSFTNAPTSADALVFSREMANSVVADFEENKVDEVYLFYNEFKSAMTQDATVKKLLPVEPGNVEEVTGGDFIYEPSKEELLEHLVPLYIQNGLFKAALESIASELGSRMSAMDSATRNAGEMIDKLTLQYNRARQAAITKELLEIISGAEALKG
jgi:F-type H+-transporting ATPase subunit gamma